MSEEHLLENPTNRVVAVFDKHSDAEAARQEFLKRGLADEQVQLAQGRSSAQDVDTAPKWFADTDEEIKRYQDELKAGHTVLTVPVSDHEARDKAHDILKSHNAHLITHFGRWVTEMMR